MTRERILIALAILLAGILFLPLRLVADGAGIGGLTARSASGSVWGGRLHDARAGAFDLGTLDIGLRPLPLLLGRASVAVDRSDGDGRPPISGIVTLSPGRRSIEGLNGSIGGGTVGGLPIESLSFVDTGILFADGRCQRASGRVTATVGLSLAGLQLRNGLSGDLSCADGVLRALMVGQSGLERLVLTVDARGNYVARLLVQTGDPVLGAALGGAGFGPTAGGFVRTARGRL